MHKLRAFTVGFAVAALAMMIVAGPGTRLEWWSWHTGITLMRAATYVALATAVVSAVLVLLAAIPRWRPRPWVPLAALCISLAAAAPPIILWGQAKRLPPIHDISTDTDDPPAFVALLEARGKSPNGAAYGGPEVAAAQRRAYPDLKSTVLARPPREAMQRALDAARDLGWEVVASDAAAGRLEATDTTAWFGFKDDIVVRVRPEGAGSRVDVRSVSRVGVSDLGANAERVRRFLARLS